MKRPSNCVRSAVVGVVALAALLGSVSAPSFAATPIQPGHLPYPSGGTIALGRGIDANGSNTQLAETLPATVKKTWQVAPPICPASAGSGSRSIAVVGQTVFAQEVGYGCTFVSAYTLSVGKLLWRRSFKWARSLAYRDGSVFVTYTDPTTQGDMLGALDPVTGATRWAAPAGGKMIAAGNGLIMTDLRALDSRTGRLKFTLALGSNASTDAVPYIAGGYIYLNSTLSLDAYSATTGKHLWSHVKSFTSPGAGWAQPVLHDGLLYVRSFYNTPTLVLNPATGKTVRWLPESDSEIAYDGNVGFFTLASPDGTTTDQLSAINLTTGARYWSKPIGGQAGAWQHLGPAPIVANGVVWVATLTFTTTPGVLQARDEITGVVRYSYALGCRAAYDAEYGNSVADLSNIAIAQHHLIVPTDCGSANFVAK